MNPDFTELINSAYQRCARISNNSWGNRQSNRIYDATSQEYDRLVREVRPTTPADGGADGNQELVIVFAAANNGPNASTFGDKRFAAKNTLLVGASENFNQAGLDGVGIGNADPKVIRHSFPAPHISTGGGRCA